MAEGILEITDSNFQSEVLESQQPVLVGTTSIEKSEIISELLKKKRVPHAVGLIRTGDTVPYANTILISG